MLEVPVPLTLIELEGHQDWRRAAELCGQAMHDNPNHLAVYPGPQARRERLQARLLRVAFETNRNRHGVCVVTAEREMVGVAVFTPSRSCRPRAREVVRLVPTLGTMGLPTARRLLRWLMAWSARDLPQPHLHVGPIAVHEEMRGQGIGSLMLQAITDRADDMGMPAYLETDRRTNVEIYRRHGFKVIGTAPVAGTTNWFMVRPLDQEPLA